MLDYTNLFECDCGHFLPFGTKKCPYCDYDYTNIEESEKKIKREKIILCIGIIWFLFAPLILKVADTKILGTLFISFFLPIILYIWSLHRTIKDYEKEKYKIESYDYLVEKYKNGDTSLDKYFGKL